MRELCNNNQSSLSETGLVYRLDKRSGPVCVYGWHGYLGEQEVELPERLCEALLLPLGQVLLLECCGVQGLEEVSSDDDAADAGHHL